MGRLRHKSALLIWAVPIAAAAVVSLSTLQVAAQSTFKVDVKLVRLLVSVKDARGQLIGSLNKSDFTVYDSGVKQDIRLFEHNTLLPLSVTVLIDNSGSTAKDLKYETTSVEKFLKALIGEGNPDDAALYSFNDDVALLSPFTRRLQRLSDSMRNLRADAGTSMYDAIFLASHDLQRRDGRHVMIIVTDGGDTTSEKKYRDAVVAAQNAESVVYPILVVPITNDAGRNLGGERALETIASDTGGRVFYPSVGVELDAAFADILRDLRTQYLVAYYPQNIPAGTPKFHPVKVELSRKELHVSTRSGYYVDAASAP